MSDQEQDQHAIQALRSAMANRVRGHDLDPAVATAVLERVGEQRRVPRRPTRWYLGVAAACVAVAAIALGAYAVRGADSGPGAAPPAGSACAGAVVTSELPDWARAGFGPDAVVNAHVTGAGGDIVGVLFGDLNSPPAPGTNNKILWVARDPGFGPLVIRAHLEGSARTVTRTVPGGPGPSTIDVPAPGCWEFGLSWDKYTDTVAVPYGP